MNSVKDLIIAVRKRVAESPDNIYTRKSGMGFCSYFEGSCTDGSCGCLFGQILAPLFGYTIYDGAGSISKIIERLWPKECVSPQSRWCRVVQSNQDGGKSWSESVKRADEAYPLEV